MKGPEGPNTGRPTLPLMHPHDNLECTECEEAFMDEEALQRHRQVLHRAALQGGTRREEAEQAPWYYGGDAT